MQQKKQLCCMHISASSMQLWYRGGGWGVDCGWWSWSIHSGV